METLIALGSIAGMIAALVGWFRSAQQKYEQRQVFEAELATQARKHEQTIKDKQAELQRVYEAERAERVKEFEILARAGDLDAVREWFDRMQQTRPQSDQPPASTSAGAIPSLTSN